MRKSYERKSLSERKRMRESEDRGRFVREGEVRETEGENERGGEGVRAIS